MLAVVDSNIPHSAVEGLRREGYDILPLPPHPALPLSVASHPDMLLFFGKAHIYTTPLYAEIAKEEISHILEITKKKLVIIQKEIQTEYPDDVLLNAFLLGDRLICHPTATATEIRLNEGALMLSTRQGYAKCSAVPVGSSALITADPSIYRTAIQSDIDVLRLGRQETHLTGYDTGFIGGATGFAPYGSVNKIYFCGDLCHHPQHKEIEHFCQLHGYTCVSLAPIPLTDVGTMIILP